jgi:formylglycine-generating enzyme required for sulfatase activity
MRRLCFILAAATLSNAAAAEPKGARDGATAEMAVVGPGTLHRFYPPKPEEADVDVPAFLLDRDPVTQSEFAAFVAEHPEWQRGHVPALFADEGYLANWETDTSPGASVSPRAPVTRVSWFSAKAYCEAKGGRLPTSDEWELAAAASETKADARKDEDLKRRVLAWYAKPLPARLPDVGKGRANYWGVRDLHGLVWEWVLDFADASVLLGTSRLRSCAATASAADDKEDYATFMRMAYRSALKARYTTPSLGFRCAADLPEDER